jgi:multiple sugar transport system permease protein
MATTTVDQPVVRTHRTAPHAGRKGRDIKIILYVFAAVLSLVVFVVPLVWALFRSLQPNDVITAPANSATFFDLTWENFRGIAAEGHILRAVGNSLIVAIGTAVLTTLLAGSSSAVPASPSR